MKRAAILFQKKVAEHDFGPGHPMRSRERLTHYLDILKSTGILNLPEVSVIEPDREVSEEELRAVHEPDLIELIQTLSRRGGRLDEDTPVPVGTYERARLQAGGLLYAAEEVMKGTFSLAIHMPAFGGHHAMRRHGAITFGFCYFNQEAVVIRSLQNQGYIKRALILDCDCHHGNGTQDIFYNDSSVLYISLHQDPHTLYPWTMGFAEEIGEGPGRGFNVNVPLPPRTGCQRYWKALTEIFPPLAREFQPDIILALLSGDTHFREPLTDFGLEMECYPRIASLVAEVAEEVCSGRLLAILSGGRNLTVGPLITCSMITTFLNYSKLQLYDPYGAAPEEPPRVARQVEEILKQVKNLLSPYWLCFQG